MKRCSSAPYQTLMIGSGREIDTPGVGDHRDVAALMTCFSTGAFRRCRRKVTRRWNMLSSPTAGRHPCRSGCRNRGWTGGGTLLYQELDYHVQLETLRSYARLPRAGICVRGVHHPTATTTTASDRTTVTVSPLLWTPTRTRGSLCHVWSRTAPTPTVVGWGPLAPGNVGSPMIMHRQWVLDHGTWGPASWKEDWELVERWLDAGVKYVNVGR